MKSKMFIPFSKCDRRSCFSYLASEKSCFSIDKDHEGRMMGKDPSIAFDSIVSLSKVIVDDENFAKNVGLLHSSIKKRKPNFSRGDAFVLQTARSLNARVLTADPDFEGIKEADMLKRKKH
ncbi:MAG TPA: hypothetical protein VNL34_02005 [Candidatus Nitrosotenuis sp.]|nr:hypothetical protein [Candidatus Nitrosotenuis sp.]